ncbi:Uncharacterised protein [Halioglobus japonicus]|nr:Uncharacterised protein [Halioglobus japonicus]
MGTVLQAAEGMIERLVRRSVISAHIEGGEGACGDVVSACWMNSLSRRAHNAGSLPIRLQESVVVSSFDDFLAAIKTVGCNVVSEVSFT